MISVLLADDQALVRTGFRLILNAEPDMEVVGEADDGIAFEATRQITAADPAVRVLMLTTFDLDDYVVAAFRAGASGFLLKTAPRDQLVAAVRTVQRGEALLAPLSRLIEQFASQPQQAPALEALTSRERDVLSRLARGLSNTEIAAELVVEPSTVKSHVASVLSKLDLRDRVQAVVYAYESGLIRPGETAKPA
jgi:DNA-binding NarL/FixJ family response regulator